MKQGLFILTLLCVCTMMRTHCTFASTLPDVCHLENLQIDNDLNTITYVNKSGKVYSANPGTTTFKSSSNEVTVKVTKTGGKAEVEVKIYVNNALKSTMQFDNGENNGKSKSKKISGVKNKTIKVKIINKSVANTFSYKLLCTGPKAVQSCQKKTLLSYSGTVYAGGPKKFTLKPNCNKLYIKVNKTGGSAKTQVSVFVDNKFMSSQKMEFANGKRIYALDRTLSNVNGKTVRIEIINQSVTNKFKYYIEAEQRK